MLNVPLLQLLHYFVHCYLYLRVNARTAGDWLFGSLIWEQVTRLRIPSEIKWNLLFQAALNCGMGRWKGSWVLLAECWLFHNTQWGLLSVKWTAVHIHDSVLWERMIIVSRTQWNNLITIFFKSYTTYSWYNPNFPTIHCKQRKHCMTT